MYRFTLELDAFDRLPEPTALELVDLWLVALSLHDEAWIRQAGAPELYGSGVRYRPEPDDTWSDVPACLLAGWADCEDLAAWRAAELRIAGVRAWPFARLEPGLPVLYHALVRTPDDTEDPSRLLGMKG